MLENYGDREEVSPTFKTGEQCPHIDGVYVNYRHMLSIYNEIFIFLIKQEMYKLNQGTNNNTHSV